MATKTETKKATEAKPEVVVIASPKIVALVKSALDAAAKAGAKFMDLALGIRAEATSKAYDEAQARKMVVLSYRIAMGLDADANEKETESFDLKYRPDVSKVMRLAFPANTKAAAELTKAIQHNEKANGNRIGVNNLLEIARGNTTTVNVVEHKRAKHAAKSGKRDAYTLENFQGELALLVSKARKADIELSDIRESFDSLHAEWVKREADEKKAAKKA